MKENCQTIFFWLLGVTVIVKTNKKMYQVFSLSKKTFEIKMTMLFIENYLFRKRKHTARAKKRLYKKNENQE